MNQIYALVLFVTSIFANSLYAQTGPGGVGSSSNLILWLKADDLNLDHNDEVNTWNDASDYTHDASDLGIFDNPYFSSNYINSSSAVRFDGVVDELGISLSASSLFGGNTQMSFYNVVKSDDASDHQGILRKAGSVSGIESAYSLYIQDSKFTAQFNYTGSNNKVQSSTSLNDNQAYILSAIYNGSLSQSNRSKLYIDGNSEATGSVDNTSMVNTGIDITIGSHVNFSLGLPVYRYLDGGIGEMIVYNTALNLAERTIVDNYLSSKHEITIADDFYSYDNTFGENVIGIGQASDGSSHTSSQGDGMVKVYVPNDLDNGEYLFIGHDGGSDQLIDTCDAPSYFSSRLGRTWRANETGDVGETAIDFDLSEISGASSSASDYALIMSSSSDFKNALTHTTGANISGSTLTFTNVDLADGEYFTLAMVTTNTIIWDGAWSNGAGAGNAPGSSETDKKIYIDAANAQITSEALCGCLNVNSGDLTITSGNTITIENQIVNNGIIEIEHSASLIQTHEDNDFNTGNGSYIINKTGHSSSTAFNIWSSPLSSTYIPTTFSNSNPCDIYVFENLTQIWNYDFAPGFSTTCNGNNVTFSSNQVIDGGDGIMDIGRGYFVPGATGGSRVFTDGTVNNGDITINITTGSHSGDTTWSGDDWNLIGNPYPSAIDITKFWSENSGTMRGGVYFWDDAGTGLYDSTDYAVYNSGGGVASHSNTTPNGHIASCQGFWVVANSNTSLIFDNSMRSSSNNQFFKRSSQNELTQTWFDLTNDAGLFNQILVSFSDEATDGFDMNYDAFKEEGNVSIAFGSMIDTNAYAIQGLFPIDVYADKTVDLYIRSEYAGEHKIEFVNSNNADDLDIYLIDTYENEEVLISDSINAYVFNTSEAVNYTDRFKLRYYKNHIPEDDTLTGINEETIFSMHKIRPVGEGMDMMRIDKGDDTDPSLLFESLQVYSVDGLHVHSDERDVLQYRFSTAGWASGVYIALVKFKDGYTASAKFVAE